jgi:uncharacterized Zn finger protein
MGAIIQKGQGNGATRADEALVLAEKLFRLRPSLERYQEIQKLADKQGRWESLRPELYDFLKKSHSRCVLVEIYLKEGEIDAALEAVKSDRGPHFGFGMDLKVAKAAKATRPREALAIYREHAEREIEHRSRHHYQGACKFLKKVANLYQGLHEEEAWQRYVAGLRQKHHSLRALQEELTKARH